MKVSDIVGFRCASLLIVNEQKKLVYNSCGRLVIVFYYQTPNGIPKKNLRYEKDY